MASRKASRKKARRSTPASAKVDPFAPGAEFEHEFEPSPEFQKVVQAPQDNKPTFDVTKGATADIEGLINRYRDANIRLVHKLLSGRHSLG
jgi:hypothetical protein